MTQCHIKDCKKKDHKHCKKPCEKPCKVEKFSSWESSNDSCDKPKCYKKCYKVCEVCCEQEKQSKCNWGYKTKEQFSREEICQEPRLHAKKPCAKKVEHARKH